MKSLTTTIISLVEELTLQLQNTMPYVRDVLRQQVIMFERTTEVMGRFDKYSKMFEKHLPVVEKVLEKQMRELSDQLESEDFSV